MIHILISVDDISAPMNSRRQQLLQENNLHKQQLASAKSKLNSLKSKTQNANA